MIAAQDRDTLRTGGASVGSVAVVELVHGAELYSQNIHIAYWDRFGDPGIPIRDGFNFDSWWVDQQKAAKNDEARR